MSNQYKPGQILDLLQSTRIDGYCVSATCALVIFDHMSTVPRELDMFWQRKINSAMLLFHLNRWTVLSWVILNIITNFLPPASLSSCISLNDLDTVAALILLAIWATFSATRTYAISGGHWPLALVVFSLGLVPVATNAYNFFSATFYEIVTIPLSGTQCGAGKRFSQATDAKFEVSTRVCVIASDTIVLGVTWFKTFKMKREADRHGVHAPLTTLLLRDGTMYFIALLCLNVLNIAGQTTNAFVYAAQLSVPLSSVIITHFLLNLRQIAQNTCVTALDSVTSDIMQVSSIRFGSFIGNMGELLDHGTEYIGTMDADTYWEDYEDAEAIKKLDSQLSRQEVVARTRG